MPSDPRDRPSSTRDDWLRDVTLLLRLRGIDGVQIGEALARVETFCDDVGVEPKELYGEPASYVATLRFEPPRIPWAATLVLPALGFVLGLNLALSGVLAWSSGAAITVGLVASMVVFVGIVGVFITFLPTLVARRGALVGWSVSGLLLMVVLPVGLTYELTRVPSVIALLLALVFLTIGVFALRRIHPEPAVSTRPRHSA